MTTTEMSDPTGPSATITCDVAAVITPDIGTIEALARLQLAVRQAGFGLRLLHPSPELRELIALAGLAAVLPCDEFRPAGRLICESAERPRGGTF